MYTNSFRAEMGVYSSFSHEGSHMFKMRVLLWIINNWLLNKASLACTRDVPRG